MSLCSKCHAEEDVPGQRYGKKCRATWQRDYRARVRIERAAYAKSLTKVRTVEPSHISPLKGEKAKSRKLPIRIALH